MRRFFVLSSLVALSAMFSPTAALSDARPAGRHTAPLSAELVIPPLPTGHVEPSGVPEAYPLCNLSCILWSLGPMTEAQRAMTLQFIWRGPGLLNWLTFTAPDWWMWAAIGRCETGMDFAHDTASYEGFTGFAVGTWDQYAPPEFPDDAWQAEPWQQVFVDRILYQRFGLRPWGCRTAV